MEIVKTLIASLLGWPVAILIVVLIFRENIAKFIERIQVFKGPGVEVNAPIGQAAQQQQVQAHNSPADAVTQLMNYGGGSPLVGEQQELISTDLRNRDIDPESADAAHILARHLAATQLQLRAEQDYRVLFGSQITALRTLNTNGPQAPESLEPLYRQAKTANESFYSGYSFDDWINILKTRGLITLVPNTANYFATIWGQTFLGWLVENKVPDKVY